MPRGLPWCGHYVRYRGDEPTEDRRQSCSVQEQTRRASVHHDRTAVADPVTEQFSTILLKMRANPLNFLFLFSTLALTCIARGALEPASVLKLSFRL